MNAQKEGPVTAKVPAPGHETTRSMARGRANELDHSPTAPQAPGATAAGSRTLPLAPACGTPQRAATGRRAGTSPGVQHG